MNLYNLVLRMVDQILSYSIARFSSYLGIRVTSNYLDMCFFVFLIQIRTIRASVSVAKMNVVGHFPLLSYRHALSYHLSQ
jgi:hypothetical protein